MANVNSNSRVWGSYDWSDRGEEWSRRWGGPDYQWWGLIAPRVRQFLPTGTLLEIAPGHGRWTQYLLPLCDRLIGVDLAANCVEACRERFGGAPHAAFHQNDGLTLEMVGDGEVDFAFSFGSLIHCDGYIVESYVKELAQKLSADGVAFLHHSNLEQYVDPQTGELPFENVKWRGLSMSAARFVEYCNEAGLLCIGQEVVRWVKRQDALSDCFSMLTRPDSRFAREYELIENRDYPEQADAMAAVARFYGPTSFPDAVAADE
ncbi:MAG TPA: class I SAM-dependent methyltransferase [Solirubrobacterales bacterium]|nr:class I SAM-dependent methyltransferase [Solirubrobacterales bacterium]